MVLSLLVMHLSYKKGTLVSGWVTGGLRVILWQPSQLGLGATAWHAFFHYGSIDVFQGDISPVWRVSECVDQWVALLSSKLDETLEELIKE